MNERILFDKIEQITFTPHDILVIQTPPGAAVNLNPLYPQKIAEEISKSVGFSVAVLMTPTAWVLKNYDEKEMAELGWYRKRSRDGGLIVGMDDGEEELSEDN